MPGKLIYRCGRFLDQGYVTLTSTRPQDDSDRAADDAVLQSLRDGQTLNGSTGHVWTLLSEGRNVTEVLAFVHGTTLPAAADAQVRERLRVLATEDLPAALSMASRDRLSPSQARAQLTDILDQKAKELSALVPVSAPLVSARPPSRRPKPTGTIWKASSALLALIGLVVVVVVVVAVAVFPTRNSIETEGRGPSREAIASVARLCHPDIVENKPDLDLLVLAIGSADWRDADTALLDYLRALPEDLRAQMAQPDLKAGELCEARWRMWEQAETLRNEATKAKAALDAARAALEENKRDLPALRLAEDLLVFLRDNPVPDQPGDCAAGLCLPLIDVADVELKRWIKRTAEAMARSLGADISDVATRLRVEEVTLRGELSLALAPSPAELSGAFAPVWSCGREPACKLPLIEATGWLEMR